MMRSEAYATQRHKALCVVTILLLFSMSYVVTETHSQPLSEQDSSFSNHIESWDSSEQPWGQYGGNPFHNGPIPPHHPNGGPGKGPVANVSILDSIDSPAINWQAFESVESDTYGSVIGNFSSSITAPEQAKERCGNNSLFPVVISSDTSSGNHISTLSIISGDDARIAWEGEIGQTEPIRSTPIIHDINGDHKPEIIVAYDTESSFHIDVWSPELTCTNATWEETGHSNELVWSYSNSDVRIASRLPHLATRETGHQAVTQPLLADLDLDGSPNLVVALVDDPDNNPVPEIASFDLTMNVPSQAKWSVGLDRGTHPSDPVFAQLDATNSVVLLTTIESSSGNMWIWKIDGETGSILWERVAVPGTDSGDDQAPRLRLPGPVITQLDEDDAPEMVITIPTDPTGRTSGTGAKFVGMEITSTDEIFAFRAPNGFADAQPIPIDTDDDSISDRLCWVTWFAGPTWDPTNREGLLGCHDISNEDPSQEWTRTLQRGGGNDNDEIAVSPPFWMDINDDGMDEILVAFGKRLFAFDGDTGASADASDGWATPLGMPHRVWAAPAIGDVDGDGSIDILIGDTLVSQSISDLEPTSDGRGISFNPEIPNPGELVTITGQFSNVGTDDPNDDVDVMLLVNGVELARQRFSDVSPSAPSGNGGPLTISATITAELGVHSIEFILDIYDNITESREDNNHVIKQLVVVEPYVAQINGPITTPRIQPGATQSVEIELLATGSQTVNWNLEMDDSSLPDGWVITPNTNAIGSHLLETNSPKPVTFDISLPSTALGDEFGIVHFTLTLQSDSNISTEFDLLVEVFRTRGLSMLGPSGIPNTTGQGRVGGIAHAWLMIENLGNAEETTTTLDWTSTSWGSTPSLLNTNGQEIFSIQLEPGEIKELFAEIDVPTNANIGDTTSTELSICIGSGNDLTCAEIVITFVVKNFVITPHHQRALPNSTLQWDISGELPDNGSIVWNLATASMLNTGWQWLGEGDVVITSTNIEFSGQPSEIVSGRIVLVLPEYTPPMRHYFDAIQGDEALNFSLQILQIHDAEIDIVSHQPDAQGQPISFNVTQTHRLLLSLGNPGNGEDTYSLSSRAVDEQGQSLDHLVDIEFLNPEKTIDARSNGIVSVDMTISDDMPALQPFVIEFTSTSKGQQTISDTIELLAQASPSKEWQIALLNSSEINLLPGETSSILIEVQNIGNAPDQLAMTPDVRYEFFGQDAEHWNISSISSPILMINETAYMNISITASTQSWHQTRGDVELRFYSNQTYIQSLNISVEILQSSGWKFNLTSMDLDIHPEGSLINLQIDHLGNSQEAPYLFKYSSGWNVSIQNNSTVVEPFGSTTMSVFIEPPQYAYAGEIEEILFQISDNDGQGLSIESIPFKVSAQPNISLDVRGQWKISELGGYPAVWVTNHGNDLARVQIEILGLPTEWTIDGFDSITLAPNELRGIPIQLIPSPDWDGFEFLAQIKVTHPELEPEIRSILVTQSDLFWTRSPVISNYDTLISPLSIHSPQAINLQDTSRGIDIVERIGNETTLHFTHGDISGQHTIDLTMNSETYNLTMYVETWNLPESDVSCILNTDVLENLKTGVFNGTIASCDITNNDLSHQRFSALFSDQYGQEYPLADRIFELPPNSTMSFNLSMEAFTIDTGMYRFELVFVDELGRNLESEAIDVVIRPTGWNIGIQSFSAKGDLQLSILRPGYEVLENEYCELDLESSSGWTLTKYVDITSATYAPIIIIEDPGVLKQDDKITARLLCNSPYDIDDNPDDNEKFAYYQASTPETISASNVGWVLGTSSILILVAWLTGFIGARRKTDTMVEMQEFSKINKQTPTHLKENNSNANQDDMSIEVIDKEEPQESVPQIDAEHNEALSNLLVEHGEPIDEDTSASHRLSSLRGEIEDQGINNREGSLEDRMNRFFDND